ncbi:MAG: hypothetical protein ACRD4S_08940 [Candidatus Acidiferrales bacterium]
MSSKSRLAMFLGVSFIFGLGSSPTAYGAPPNDACSLLTPAQVSAVLDVPATGKALGPKACIWVQTDVKPGSPRRRVDLLLLLIQGFTGGYAAAKMPNASTSATHVSGLGDDAYYLSMTQGRQYMELRVRKGSVAFGTRVQSSGTPFTLDQIKAKEKMLALDVLAKL